MVNLKEGGYSRSKVDMRKEEREEEWKKFFGGLYSAAGMLSQESVILGPDEDHSRDTPTVKEAPAWLSHMSRVARTTVDKNIVMLSTHVSEL